ncbi:hypothetical protein ACROYT_G017879 [Oculina patagonica]
MPTCEPIDCGVLQTPDKAEKVFETHTRVVGVVRFKCKEKGYEISGSEIRTCQNDESWSGFPTTCKIISCGNPDKYTLSVERSKIFCEDTKDWSLPIPRCWAPCSDPGMLGNGRRTGDDFRHGKSVTFKCKVDYELKGKATISCNNGICSDDIPQCTAPCPDPGTPDNGIRMGDDFKHGKYVKGKAKQVVASFLFLDSEDAYEKAKEMLPTWFGDPFVVVSSCRSKLDSWSTIHPNDGPGMRKFANYLVQCEQLMKSNGSLRVLDDDQENRKLASKLPRWASNRWRRAAFNWKEEKGTFPPFSEFVKFVVREADIACDPTLSSPPPSNNNLYERKRSERRR